MRGKSSGRSLSAVNVIVEFMMVRRCCSELAFHLSPVADSRDGSKDLVQVTHP